MQNEMALRDIQLTIVGSGEPLLRLQKRLVLETLHESGISSEQIHVDSFGLPQ